MTAYLSIAILLLKIVSWIIDQKKLSDAEAAIVQAETEKLNARLADAAKARGDAESDFDAHGVPDVDPNRRD